MFWGLLKVSTGFVGVAIVGLLLAPYPPKSAVREACSNLGVQFSEGSLHQIYEDRCPFSEVLAQGKLVDDDEDHEEEGRAAARALAKTR